MSFGRRGGNTFVSSQLIPPANQNSGRATTRAATPRSSFETGDPLRQQLLELGEPAIRYLTEIVHRRPRQWYEDVDRLHQILQSHGPDVLRRAMEEGLKQQIYGAFYVERSLQPGLSFTQVTQ